MNKICCTCLSRDRKVEPICELIRSLFFTLISRSDKTENILLCWECKSRLQHIHLFCKKAQYSQNILDDHLKNGTKEMVLMSKSSLVISKTELYEYPIIDNTTNSVNTYIPKIHSEQNDAIVPVNTCIPIETSDQNNAIRHKIKLSHQTNLNKKNLRVKNINLKRFKKEVKNVHNYFMCKVCGMIFKTRGKYEYHKEVHETKPQCKDCERVFANKSSLWRHRNIIHNNTKTYTCEICKKQFFTEAGYQSHVSNHPDSSVQYFCRPCGKFFKTNSSLRKHQRISKKHVDPKAWKYSCSQCSRKFPSEILFKEHQNMIHLNGKRFMCKECPRRYCTTRSLRIHIKLKHENISQAKNNVCEFCGKIFKASQVLKSHIRTHTGERPYPCSLCQARFTQSSALRTHTRLVHLRKK